MVSGSLLVTHFNLILPTKSLMVTPLYLCFSTNATSAPGVYEAPAEVDTGSGGATKNNNKKIATATTTSSTSKKSNPKTKKKKNLQNLRFHWIFERGGGSNEGVSPKYSPN